MMLIVLCTYLFFLVSKQAGTGPALCGHFSTAVTTTLDTVSFLRPGQDVQLLCKIELLNKQHRLIRPLMYFVLEAVQEMCSINTLLIAKCVRLWNMGVGPSEPTVRALLTMPASTDILIRPFPVAQPFCQAVLIIRVVAQCKPHRSMQKPAYNAVQVFKTPYRKEPAFHLSTRKRASLFRCGYWHIVLEYNILLIAGWMHMLCRFWSIGRLCYAGHMQWLICQHDLG